MIVISYLPSDSNTELRFAEELMALLSESELIIVLMNPFPAMMSRSLKWLLYMNILLV